MTLERVQLTRRLHLWQRRRGHRSATDDVLCAWAGLRACPDATRVLDLGCGQGSVTLMLAGALPDARLVGVEVQAVSFELLERNVTENGLAERVRTVHADLRELALDDRFHVVTGSPPFMPLGSGTLPKDPQRAGGRFELRGGIEDYALAAARHLAPEGVASLLMDGAQDVRCRAALEAAGLVLVRLIRVLPREGAEPRYLIYQAARSESVRSRCLTPGSDIFPIEALAVRDAAGSWTAEFQAVRDALDLPGR